MVLTPLISSLLPHPSNPMPFISLESKLATNIQTNEQYVILDYKSLYAYH